MFWTFLSYWLCHTKFAPRSLNWFHNLFVNQTQKNQWNHSVKYCEMMGQINFAFNATVINISFNRLWKQNQHIWLLFLLIHITYCTTHFYIHRKFRRAFFVSVFRFFSNFSNSFVSIIIFTLMALLSSSSCNNRFFMSTETL